MSDIVKIPSMRPEPARSESGLYLLPDPETGQTREWTRATTIAHTLDDDYHLTLWKRRMVLQGAAMKPGLLAGVPELTGELERVKDDWRAAKDIKRQLNELCDEAAKAAGDGRAADLGTLLHTITEYDDAGRIAEIEHLIPDMLMADLEAYRRTMDAAGLGRPPEYIERIVVNTQVDGAGTFDRFLRILADGRLVCGDLKTGGSVELNALGFSIQFSEYVNGDAMYDDATGSLVPLPPELDKTFGIVIHLPVGKATCTLYELDLEAGWEAAQVAHWVRQRRASAKSLIKPYTVRAAQLRCPECVTPDEDPRAWCDCTGDEPPCTAPCRQRSHEPSRCPSAGDHVLRLIYSAGHPSALVALWRDLDAKGQWTGLHTAAAAAKKAQLSQLTRTG